jgi:F-type H+-transporting ATPase subunit b
MEKLGINLGYLIFFILNFLLLLILLKAWVYEPILNMLEQRKTAIAQGVEDARVAGESRANAEKEAAKIIAAAQATAAQRISEMTAQAEKEAASTRAAGEEERRKLLKAAEEDARLERERHLADLRGQVGALAIAAANRIIGETLDERRQRALIDELFNGVKAGKVVVLEGESLSAQTDGQQAAVITSALPLTADEQVIARQDILSRLGGAASVAFKVDPDILGGLIVRVGYKVIDGSVAGRLEGLKASLK